MSAHHLQALLPGTSPWSNLPLSTLDTAMAHLLQHAQPSTDVRHLWLAALTHQRCTQGHACLELNALSKDSAAVLGWNADQIAELPADLAVAATTLPWTTGADSPLVLQDQRLYLRRAWVAEQTIRRVLIERTQPLPPVDTAQVATWIDALFSGLGSTESELAQQADQRSACMACLKHGLTLVSGGPGTGKTTTVARMLALMQRVHARRQPDSTLRILLAAPTGKASARLAESMQSAIDRLPLEWRTGLPDSAATLHRLLIEQNTIWDVDVLVIDEASMVDLELMARVLRALPESTRLILLGDPDQLASVEAGAVLSQLCAAPWLKRQHVHLSHSHRFRADQGIGQWARWVQQDESQGRQDAWEGLPQGWIAAEHQVTRLGRFTPQSPTGKALLRHAFEPWWQQVQSALHGPETPQVSDTVARQLLDGFSQVGVLCALRDGPWGVAALNQQIAMALGLDSALWCAGRPVMVTRNNPGLNLMNGDIGLCLPHVLPDGRVVLRVAFAHQDSVRWIAPARLDDVEPVFAMTVHKSQGSEFNHVLLVLPERINPVLTRELIYTGVTRAKERLTWWVPEPEVLFNACERRVARSGGLSEPVD